MDRQDQARQKMIEIVENLGIKYRFISKQTGISPQLLSRFKMHLTNLGQDNIEALEKFIEKYK